MSIQKGGRGKTTSDDKIEVYLFKADWCPHCTAFLSTWSDLKKKYSSKYTFIKLDSDKDAKKISKWGIKGFPTIVVKHKDNALEYVGPRDFDSVLDFIKMADEDIANN